MADETPETPPVAKEPPLQSFFSRILSDRRRSTATSSSACSSPGTPGTYSSPVKTWLRAFLPDCTHPTSEPSSASKHTTSHHFPIRQKLFAPCRRAQKPLDPTELRRVIVRGDGNCLFRAISKNFAYFDRVPLSDEEELAHASTLRQLAWNAICIERAEEFQRRNIIEGGIHTYAAYSRMGGYFAGEAEIFALSDALQVGIVVYILMPGGSHHCIGVYGEGACHGRRGKRGDGFVRLLYVRGNHYDALLPVRK